MTREERIIARYMHATNAIDDYFEYRCKSPEDQAMVHEILNTLTGHLKSDAERLLTSGDY